MYVKDIISWNPKVFSCLDAIQVQFQFHLSTQPPLVWLLALNYAAEGKRALLKCENQWSALYKSPNTKTVVLRGNFHIFLQERTGSKVLLLEFYDYTRRGCSDKEQNGCPKEMQKGTGANLKGCLDWQDWAASLALGVRKKGLWTWRHRIGALTLI